MHNKLYRSNNKIIGGVCAGIAEYFNIDPTVIRLIWVATVIFMGTGIFFYLLAWLIIPERTL